MDGPAHVPFPRPNQRALDGKLALADRPVRQQEILLVNAVGGELRGQRAIGQRGFREDHDSRGLLVEPVNDGQPCPPGLSVPQPVVETFTRVRARRMGIQAGGFVHHQQMLIFEDQARQHGQVKAKG